MDKIVSTDRLVMDTTLRKDGDDYLMYVGKKKMWTLRATVESRSDDNILISVFNQKGECLGNTSSNRPELQAVVSAMHFRLLPQ